MWGKRLWPMSITTLDQRLSLREKSLLSREESPPRHNVAEDGGDNLPPVVTISIISRSGKSTKAENDNESVERKGCIITFGALCLTRSYLSVLTTTPNNWKEGLIKQVPTLRALFRKKETTIKRE